MSSCRQLRRRAARAPRAVVPGTEEAAATLLALHRGRVQQEAVVAHAPLQARDGPGVRGVPGAQQHPPR
eukprot:1607810-Rhodomonas_salina.1